MEKKSVPVTTVPYSGLMVYDFVGCCGINIIEGFPIDEDGNGSCLETKEYGKGKWTEHGWEEGPVTRITRYDLVAGLKEAKESGHRFHNQPPGLFLAALNEIQVEACSRSMKEAGYKKLQKFRNPKTGLWITLYGKLVGQPKKTKKIKRTFNG